MDTALKSAEDELYTMPCAARSGSDVHAIVTTWPTVDMGTSGSDSVMVQYGRTETAGHAQYTVCTHSTSRLATSSQPEWSARAMAPS
jgi:hypothetical protein